MQAPAAHQRPIIAIAAEAFVFIFAIVFGLMVLLPVVVLPIVHLVSSDAPLADVFRKLLPRLLEFLEVGIRAGVAFGLGAAVFVAAFVRWRHFLIPEPTEAERTRRISLIRVACSLAVVSAGVLSLIAVVASAFRLELREPLSSIVASYDRAVAAGAGALEPVVATLVALFSVAGLDNKPDPLWPHGVIVFTAWFAQLALAEELFPEAAFGRPSLRRLRLLAVFWIVMTVAVIVGGPVELPLGALTIMAALSVLERLFVIRSSDVDKPWRRAAHDATELAIWILAALGILVGRSGGA